MSYVMENEINSQGQVIEGLINKYIINYCVLMDIPLEIKRVTIVASGSSYNAGMYGKQFFEKIAKVPASLEYASEVANDFYNFSDDSLYIFVSQSGNSTDTVVAMQKAKDLNVKTMCITNNLESKMYEMADYKFDLEAGRENAIAATKTFSATVVMFWLIACKIAQNKHLDISEETKNIYSIRKNIENAMKDIDNIDVAVKFLSKFKDFSICGFGYNYALSCEAALKIKETCYINTNAYPIGEFIHGHFAVLNKSKVFLTFMTSSASDYELNLLKRIKSTYKSKTVVISDIYEDYECDILVKFNQGQSQIANIVNMILVIQMLALKMAIKLKRNVDKPIGLSKVVENKE